MLQVYAERAQKLDRTFPNRLLAEHAYSINQEELSLRYAQQQEKFHRLYEASLLDPAEELPLPSRKLTPTWKRVLKTYLDDNDRKLAVFDEILKKTELLQGILNRRFSGKVLTLDRSEGFRITTDSGWRIPPEQLSSGEQHELVLVYRLLFVTNANSTVLIDEPELSMHVSWQRAFLEDLESIQRLVPLDFIVATHSPQIVNGRDEALVLMSPGSDHQ